MKTPVVQALNYQSLCTYYRVKARILQVDTSLAITLRMKRSKVLQESIRVIFRFDDATLD
jgi:hypothetical protein